MFVFFQRCRTCFGMLFHEVIRCLKRILIFLLSSKIPNNALTIPEALSIWLFLFASFLSAFGEMMGIEMRLWLTVYLLIICINFLL